VYVRDEAGLDIFKISSLKQCNYPDVRVEGWGKRRNVTVVLRTWCSPNESHLLSLWLCAEH
jgi:hypothetical protein